MSEPLADVLAFAFAKKSGHRGPVTLSLSRNSTAQIIAALRLADADLACERMAGTSGFPTARHERHIARNAYRAAREAAK